MTFLFVEFLFLGSGILLLVFPLVTESQMSENPTAGTIARNLIIMRCPLKASIGNAVLIFITFVIALPAIIMPTSRGWLKFHGYMAVVCAIFTLVIGLNLWFDTLKTRSNLSDLWVQQSPATQSLIQQQLSCCGYTNSIPPSFVTDSTCSSSVVAAQLGPCIGPFSNFANGFLNTIFTAAFGLVGMDVVLILTTSMLLKDRKEMARYRHIDEKRGAGAF